MSGAEAGWEGGGPEGEVRPDGRRGWGWGAVLRVSGPGGSGEELGRPGPARQGEPPAEKLPFLARPGRGAGGGPVSPARGPGVGVGWGGAGRGGRPWGQRPETRV